MSRGDTSNITISSDVVKRFGEVSKELLVGNGTGSILAFSTGQRYINFAELTGQIDAVRKKLADIKQRDGHHIRLSGMEFLTEEEMQRREAEDEEKARLGGSSELLEEKDALLRQLAEEHEKLESAYAQDKQLMAEKLNLLGMTKTNLEEQLAAHTKGYPESKAKATSNALLGAAIEEKNTFIQQLTGQEENLKEDLSQEKYALNDQLSLVELAKQILEEQLEASNKNNIQLSEMVEEKFALVQELTDGKDRLQTEHAQQLEELTQQLSSVAADKAVLQEELQASLTQVKAQATEENSSLMAQMEQEKSQSDSAHAEQMQTLNDQLCGMHLNIGNLQDNLESTEKNNADLKEAIATKDASIAELSQEKSSIQASLTDERDALSQQLVAQQELMASLQTSLEAEREDFRNKVIGRDEILHAEVEKGKQFVGEVIKPLIRNQVCLTNQSAVLECYRNNKDQPLRCSHLVKEFIGCVQGNRNE